MLPLELGDGHVHGHLQATAAVLRRPGGNQPSVYETIQTADLFRDGHAEVLGRSSAGIDYARWNAAAGRFEDVTQTGIAPDVHDGRTPRCTTRSRPVISTATAKLTLMLLAGRLRW